MGGYYNETQLYGTRTWIGFGDWRSGLGVRAGADVITASNDDHLTTVSLLTLDGQPARNEVAAIGSQEFNGSVAVAVAFGGEPRVFGESKRNGLAW